MQTKCTFVYTVACRPKHTCTVDAAYCGHGCGQPYTRVFWTGYQARNFASEIRRMMWTLDTRRHYGQAKLL